MTWQKINKPTSSNWMNTNPGGRTQYDQSNITYDDASTFYDGVDYGAWSKVSKPATSNWTKVSKPT